MKKVYTLSEAVKRFIHNGDFVAFGGFTTNRKPIAAVHEILRQGLKDFILAAVPAGSEADMLIGAGYVRIYNNCYTANSGVTNVCKRFRQAIEKKSILFEDYSQDAAILMLHGASLGLPFVPIRMMLGSDLVHKWGISEEERQDIEKLHDKKFIIQNNPFTPSEKIVFLPVPSIDVAIIHVQKASHDGTCIIEGDEFHDVDIAIAAKRCIVTCEELVTDEYIRREPERASIPGFVIDAVVHVPYGAHPSQCYNYYDYDSLYYMMYDKVSSTQEDFDQFIREWVIDTKDHEGYLNKLGGTRLINLKTVSGFGYHVDMAELAKGEY
jgi:glutaconate CoA-transferase subunit A